MKKVIFLSLVLSLPLAAMYPEVYPQKETQSKMQKQLQLVRGNLLYAIVGCGIAACAYAFYKLITYELSDEDLIARSKQAVDKMASDVSFLEKIIYVRSSNYFKESQLEKLVSHYHVLKKLNHCSTWNEQLHKELYDIKQRIARRIKKNIHFAHDSTSKQLQFLEQRIEILVGKVESLNFFWNEHQGYFALHDTILQIKKNYAKALSDSGNYTNIRQVVMRTRLDYGYTYPYREYVQKLQSNSASIDRKMQNLTHSYFNLESAAVSLHAHLNAIIDLIIMNADYQHDLDLYEQHKLEQKRIAVMEEKARAEREKARAMQQQAEAQMQQAQAQREQAQNQQPTVINVVQPQPEPMPSRPPGYDDVNTVEPSAPPAYQEF